MLQAPDPGVLTSIPGAVTLSPVSPKPPIEYCSDIAAFLAAHDTVRSARAPPQQNCKASTLNSHLPDSSPETSPLPQTLNPKRQGQTHSSPPPPPSPPSFKKQKPNSSRLEPNNRAASRGFMVSGADKFGFVAPGLAAQGFKSFTAVRLRASGFGGVVWVFRAWGA